MVSYHYNRLRAMQGGISWQRFLANAAINKIIGAL